VNLQQQNTPKQESSANIMGDYRFTMAPPAAYFGDITSNDFFPKKVQSEDPVDEDDLKFTAEELLHGPQNPPEEDVRERQSSHAIIGLGSSSKGLPAPVPRAHSKGKGRAVRPEENPFGPEWSAQIEREGYGARAAQEDDAAARQDSFSLVVDTALYQHSRAHELRERSGRWDAGIYDADPISQEIPPPRPLPKARVGREPDLERGEIRPSMRTTRAAGNAAAAPVQRRRSSWWKRTSVAILGLGGR
jgi:hypothetical protein